MTMTETVACPPGGTVAREFMMEANHRIANHLTLVMSMVQLQAASIARGPETLTRQDVHGVLRETAGKIASVAHLHRKLAEAGNGDRIDLDNYLIESCAYLISSLALKGRVGFVQLLDKDCYVTSQQAQSIGLIVSEVMMNAVKHAHPSGIPVQIRLVCRRGKDHSLLVEIEDDGVGLPENFDPVSGGGVGFTLIRSLAKTLGATLTVESDSLGTSFRLLIPGKPDLS
jgi:two-component sensor histidine kinase